MHDRARQICGTCFVVSIWLFGSGTSSKRHISKYCMKFWAGRLAFTLSCGRHRFWAIAFFSLVVGLGFLRYISSRWLV